MEVTLNKKTKAALSVAAIALFLVFVYLGDIMISPGSSWKMLITVIEKGSIYALVAASMNLLNGFTGLFSLGQAGFMLIGAYTYAIFTIPAASHDAVYQYFEGGVIKWSIVEALEGSLGVFGHYLGMLIPMLGAGLLVAVIAFLIGIPVLRLKSDYLAIATLGFAEILRAFFQWNTLGPVTNGSNVLRKYTTYGNAIFPVLISGICIAIILLLINSTYGRAFRAIRDDEIAAEAMGINLFRHKEISFVISSFVGPRPPVVRTISLMVNSLRRLFRISSRSSPMESMRVTRMPASSSATARREELVSTTWPMRISSPMVQMEAWIMGFG